MLTNRNRKFPPLAVRNFREILSIDPSNNDSNMRIRNLALEQKWGKGIGPVWLLDYCWQVIFIQRIPFRNERIIIVHYFIINANCHRHRRRRRRRFITK